MNTPEIILIIASVLTFFFGIFPYILKTLKGVTQPNRITWAFQIYLLVFDTIVIYLLRNQLFKFFKK